MINWHLWFALKSLWAKKCSLITRIVFMWVDLFRIQQNNPWKGKSKKIGGTQHICIRNSGERARKYDYIFINKIWSTIHLLSSGFLFACHIVTFAGSQSFNVVKMEMNNTVANATFVLPHQFIPPLNSVRWRPHRQRRLLLLLFLVNNIRSLVREYFAINIVYSLC